VTSQAVHTPRQQRRAVTANRSDRRLPLVDRDWRTGTPQAPTPLAKRLALAPPPEAPVEAGRALRIGVLGPLQVCLNGREVALPQAKLRQLLAILATRENQVVSNDTLIHELWGQEPPRTALRALRVYVSQLRKFFVAHRVDEGQCRIVTQPPGYRLILADGVLDRHHFSRHCDRARAALAAQQLDLASHCYREALTLSRGAALADVRVGPTLQGTGQWLDEVWLATLLRCIDLELQLGGHLEVISELTRLTAEQPLNEGLHSRLMIALYRSGRTSDALAVYRSIRDLMVEELGTEPGLELRRVHQAILAADPAALQGSDLWTL
jgi:SARP family transcriptional regulator, regulator of embCAB operon